ncbi:MAG: chorismate synthase [Oscillospiraceae bacterium]
MSIWNNGIGLSIFGEARSDFFGISIDSIPEGYAISYSKLLQTMHRHRQKQTAKTQKPYPEEVPRIVSGIYGGSTTGAPICLTIQNENIDYDDFSHEKFSNDALRPSHADLTAQIKYCGYQDKREGGHFSGQLTAAIVAAGGICEQILAQNQIFTATHLLKIGEVEDVKFDKSNINARTFERLNSGDVFMIDSAKFNDFLKLRKECREKGDSVGSIVECVAIGVPQSLGGPYFENFKATISSLIFAIPGVTGLSFGEGFNSAYMYGSEYNDEFTVKNNKICTKTNNCGGIQGGISNGMPLILTVSFKPSPSIKMKQKSVIFSKKAIVDIENEGEYDFCIGTRGSSVIHSCIDIAILSQIVKYKKEIL